MMGHGHESWHPDPEFYYQVGGGPMFDMGPYYLTALVNLVGPVRRVTGSARITFPERTITSQTQVSDTRSRSRCRRTSPACWTLPTGRSARSSPALTCGAGSCRASRSTARRARSACPIPTPLAGRCVSAARGSQEWQEVPLAYGYAENSRGLGVADMAHALRSGRTAPRQRRADLSRAGHHARHPRCLARGTAHRAREHLRAARRRCRLGCGTGLAGRVESIWRYRTGYRAAVIVGQSALN